MQFTLTDERIKYLESRGRVVLNACPGSGKTTSVAKKILTLGSSSTFKEEQFYGFACLSFTNTAKNEIHEKYKAISGNTLNYPHIVSTIDSFINKYITLPFINLLNEDFPRPSIRDEAEVIDNAWKGHYKFRINNRPVFFSYKPSKIRIEKDGSFTFEGNRPNLSQKNLRVFDNYAKALKKWQFENGLITTTDSAYIAFRILSKYPQIAKCLSIRFPYIIIDEAQDTSEIQHAIFDCLASNGLKNIDLVGDPYQCIYEWRDAEPQLFIEKYNNTDDWQGLNLTNNWRSNQRIIDTFSILRKESDYLIKSNVSKDKNIPITVYRYTSKNPREIIDDFRKKCLENNLSEFKIVVRGKSRRDRMLGIEAQQEPWKSPIPYKLIKIMMQLSSNSIKEAVNLMKDLYLDLDFKNKSYEVRKDILNLINENDAYNAEFYMVIKNLPSLDLSLSEWSSLTEEYLKKELSLDNKPNFSIKKRSSNKFDRKILKDSVSKHLYSNFKGSTIPIDTIHSVKGETLEAILIFFDETNNKETIHFNDLTRPSNLPTEMQRLIYVAMSRPTQFLSLAFPDELSEEMIRETIPVDIDLVNI